MSKEILRDKIEDCGMPDDVKKNVNRLMRKKDWSSISQYQKLSESFIEKYKDKVDWFCISACQDLSESFIEKYKDKVDWANILQYQKLSKEFMEKMGYGWAIL